jgi:hypothetical protein
MRTNSVLTYISLTLQYLDYDVREFETLKGEKGLMILLRMLMRISSMLIS